MIKIKKKRKAPFVSDKDVCAFLYMDKGLRARIGDQVFGEGSGDGMAMVVVPIIAAFPPEATIEFRWLNKDLTPGPSVWARPDTVGGWAEALRRRGLTAAERKDEDDERRRVS